ncbi:MAG: septal ring lytic transglycosylase RlpA family protein [Coriobacteriales bacterium]|nr:septal ring lytic transglycosylase RlpA family protein [Coriobacteriales bacterium]
MTTTKVLGVGRIQSSTSDVAVTSVEKFAVPASETTEERGTGLAEPVAREAVSAPEAEPTPTPTPTPTPAPTQTTSNPPAADAAGWRTTLATNYATHGDNFLNKPTASGALTTTTSMGVAHKSLPLGTVIEIYCPKTGLSCIATVNDRGPYDGRPDTFDFQMGVTSALGENYGWYTVQYRIVS